MKKLLLAGLLLVVSLSAMSKDVKAFNKVLIDDVQQDIKNQNDVQFQDKRSRGPASVTEEVSETTTLEENKIDKNFKQFGHKNW